MPCLLTYFSAKQKVQVIDKSTGIWTKAEVLSIAGSWKILIKWIGFNQEKFPPEFIIIPEHLQTNGTDNSYLRAQWPIRQWTEGTPDEELPRSKRRSTTKAPPVGLRTRTRGEEVYFIQDDEDDTLIRRGWVYENDPFYRTMKICPAHNDDDEWEPNTTTATMSIPYKFMRAKPKPEMPASDDDSSGDETDTREAGTSSAPPVKRIRVAANTPHGKTPEAALEELASQLESK